MPHRSDDVGCGKTFQLAEPLEQLIKEAILYCLDSPDFAHTLAVKASDDIGSAELEQELEADRHRLDELAEMYGLKEMTAREWMSAKAPIQQRISENERRLGAVTGTSALDGYVGHGDALRRQWDALSPSRQRAIVSALLESVVIGPAVRGRNVFDPTRVTPNWRA